MAQLGKSDLDVGGPEAALWDESTSSLGQLLLRFEPVAAPDQHTRQAHPTDTTEKSHLANLGVFAHPVAPLNGSLVVSDSLAGVDQVAERPGHVTGIGHSPAQC